MPFLTFLTGDYLDYYNPNLTLDPDELRTVVPAAVKFEIEDKKDTILQPSGKGVAVFRRGDYLVQIVDMEDFTKKVHGENNTPGTCDFVLTSIESDSFIVLNELTRSESQYVTNFTQPKTGEARIGKMEYARQQIIETIERCYAVSDFIDTYENKIGLFSCRLSDKSKNSPMARSARSFSKPVYILERMKLKQELPHGFSFEMRIYQEPYSLPAN